MLEPIISSGGFLGIRALIWGFNISPAYYFSYFGSDVPYFISEKVRFDFYELYFENTFEGFNLKIGKFRVLDTSNIALNGLSRGLNSIKISKGFYDYALISGRDWISDSEYYFMPAGRNIKRGEVITRYMALKGVKFKGFEFYELGIWSGPSGSFPDLVFLNPLMSSYLYQWFKGREVNVIWIFGYKNKIVDLQVLLDDIQYLPSWWDSVPHKFGIRLHFNGFLNVDLAWITAFVYGNRKAWDANFEAPPYGSDYFHANFRYDLKNAFLGFGLYGVGKFNGRFKEPSIGEYPKFSFLHDPTYNGWLEFGLKLRGFHISVGYGKKPFSLSNGDLFVWFSRL